MDEQYKWKIPKRKESNQELLSILQEIVNKHPELRFGQIISNLRVVDWERKQGGGVEMYDPFFEESVDTLKRVKEQYYGKDKV
jgi:hypothetical protein